MDRDQRAADAREALAAKREHSKGDGNFPRTAPRGVVRDEAPEDHMPRDVRKERDPRSAPKGAVTKGQEERNPDLELRDEAEPELKGRTPPSGFETAIAAADEEIAARRPKPPAKRPNARRSSAAKREATRRAPKRLQRRTGATTVPQAPKSSERSARRAAVERRPGVGKRRTGTAKTAKPKTVRGSRAGRGT
ncbi:MAG: hypothetical protein ACRDGT_10125 [Candidatus Limnocylindria bacterium]